MEKTIVIYPYKGKLSRMDITYKGANNLLFVLRYIGDMIKADFKVYPSMDKVKQN